MPDKTLPAMTWDEIAAQLEDGSRDDRRLEALIVQAIHATPMPGDHDPITLSLSSWQLMRVKEVIAGASLEDDDD